MPRFREGLRGRILVAGPSGSGKSTLARHLRRQGTMAVDADAIPGLGRQVDPMGRRLARVSHEDYLQVKGWRFFWDEKVLKNFLSRNPHVVICGGSDNLFDLDLARLFDRRIFLHAPWSVIHARLNDPKRDNDWGRDTRPAQRAWVENAVESWPARAREAGFEMMDATKPIAVTLRRVRGEPRKSERSWSRVPPIVTVQVALSSYTVAREPDFDEIGAEVDRAIESNFPDGTYIVRAIGLDLDNDPGLREDMVATLLAKGTDKTDPERKSVGFEEFSGYDYDIHAGKVEVKHSRLVAGLAVDKTGVRSWFGSTAWRFYHGAKLDRGHPVRLDLLMFYDPRKVVRARKFHPGGTRVRRGLAQHLYRFKDREDKRSALLGLVEILR